MWNWDGIYAWGETHKPLPEVKKNDEGWKRIIIIELAIHTIIWYEMQWQCIN